MTRPVTEVILADGKPYRFAQIPASTALAMKFVNAVEGVHEMDADGLKGLHVAFRTSLKLAGHSPDEIEEILFLVDLQDQEVVQRLSAAVFPPAFRSKPEAVDAADGAVRTGVGTDAGASGGAGGDRGDQHRGDAGGVRAGTG